MTNRDDDKPAVPWQQTPPPKALMQPDEPAAVHAVRADWPPAQSAPAGLLERSLALPDFESAPPEPESALAESAPAPAVFAQAAGLWRQHGPQTVCSP